MKFGRGVHFWFTALQDYELKPCFHRISRQSSGCHWSDNQRWEDEIQPQCICEWESLPVRGPSYAFIILIVQSWSMRGKQFNPWVSWILFQIRVARCWFKLRTWRGQRGEEWSSAQGMESILISIQSLLSSNPYENEPGYETATADHDKRHMKHYVRKVRLPTWYIK